MGVSWWESLPTSPPLDTEAEPRFRKREGRMKDVLFGASCELAGIPATPRQARKWNNGKGLALRFKSQARELL